MNVRKTELYESFVYDEKDMCAVKDVESGQAATKEPPGSPKFTRAKKIFAEQVL